MTSRRKIEGHDGPVEFDETRQTVTKTYTRLKHEIAIEKLNREVAYASRFFESLSHVEGLSCPRILGWDLSVPPRIVMSLCPGEALSSYLRRVGKHDPRNAEIACKIHDGLEIYVRLFAEPYHDICFQNLLYDEATGILTFLDFGIPERIDRSASGSPLAVSLGNLVGWACYDMVRPSRLFAAKQGYLEVMAAILARFEGRVPKRLIHDAARAAFARLTEAGTTARRTYYKLAETVVASLVLKQLKPDLRPVDDHRT